MSNCTLFKSSEPSKHEAIKSKLTSFKSSDLFHISSEGVGLYFPTLGLCPDTTRKNTLSTEATMY